MPPSLLVSGIGKRNALLRLLRTECAEHDVRVVGCDAARLPPARFELDEFHTIPRADDRDFLSTYAEVLARVESIAHLTLVDPEIPLLGALEESGGAAGSRLMHPVRSSATLCEDKLLFYEFLQRENLPGIETSVAPGKWSPLIRKDRKGSAASGFRVFQSPSEALKAFEGGNDGQAPAAVFQPFCDGQHYCIDAYFSWKTNSLVDLCVKKVLSKTRGESYLLESVRPDRFVDLVEGVARKLPLRGIVNFDVYDDEGLLRLMEINCRIGGNYPASHEFGCNLLRHLLVDTLDAGPTAVQRTSYTAGRFVAKYFEFTKALDISD